jgi:hypothetical protein
MNAGWEQVLLLPGVRHRDLHRFHGLRGKRDDEVESVLLRFGLLEFHFGSRDARDRILSVQILELVWLGYLTTPGRAAVSAKRRDDSFVAGAPGIAS